MTGCPFNSASENIADFIYRYGSRQQFFGNSKDIPCMDFVSTDFSIIYTPRYRKAHITKQVYLLQYSWSVYASRQWQHGSFLYISDSHIACP